MVVFSDDMLIHTPWSALMFWTEKALYEFDCTSFDVLAAATDVSEKVASF